MSAAKRSKGSGGRRRATSGATRAAPGIAERLEASVNQVLDQVDRFAEELAKELGLRDEPRKAAPAARGRKRR